MRTFLLFISGMLTAALVIVGAALFFWRTSITPPAPGTAKVNEAHGENVLLTATITMPPEIRIYKPKNSRYVALMTYGPAFRKFLTLDGGRGDVLFPHKISRFLPREEFDRMVREAEGNFALWILYAPSEHGGSNLLLQYFEPGAFGFNLLPSSIFAAKSNVYDLGKAHFSFVFPKAYNDKCVSTDTLLEGKIFPVAALQKNFEGAKFALVIYPDSPEILAMPPTASTTDFDKYVLHYQYLDFSKGPAAIAIPPKPSSSALLRVVEIRCNANEDLKTCAQGAFPPSKALQNFSRAGVLTDDHLEVPVCGTHGFIGGRTAQKYRNN